MAEGLLPHHDLGGYVLGTLTPAEANAFEAHLPGCPGCSAEVAELGTLPSLLASAAPSPPLTLRQRTFDAIAAAAGGPASTGGLSAGSSALPGGLPTGSPGPPTSGQPPVGTPQVVTPMRPRRPRTVRWMAAAAAALLVVAAVGVGAVLLGRDRGSPSTTVALAAVDGGSGSGEAVIRQVAGGREVRLEVSGLPVNQPGTFYECWLVGQSDTAQAPNRVSVGTFTVGADGTASVVWVSAADPARFPRMGVTLEPDDGDPAANGPKVLAGQ